MECVLCFVLHALVVAGARGRGGFDGTRAAGRGGGGYGRVEGGDFGGRAAHEGYLLAGEVGERQVRRFEWWLLEAEFGGDEELLVGGRYGEFGCNSLG